MILDYPNLFSFYQVKIKLESIGKLYLHYLGSNQIMQGNCLVISPFIHLVFQNKIILLVLCYRNGFITKKI